MHKLPFIAVLLALTSTTVFADDDCTYHPREQWIKQEDLRRQLETQGYNVQRLKVSDQCYEMHGRDKDGRRVEIDFDTVSGKPVKTEIWH